jgi:hypothetical protein
VREVLPARPTSSSTSASKPKKKSR